MKEESVPATPGPLAQKPKHPGCQCSLCTYWKDTELVLKNGTIEELRAWCRDMYNRWQHESFDLEWDLCHAEEDKKALQARLDVLMAEGPALPESNPIPNPREGAKP